MEIEVEVLVYYPLPKLFRNLEPDAFMPLKLTKLPTHSQLK